MVGDHVVEQVGDHGGDAELPLEAEPDVDHDRRAAPTASAMMPFAEQLGADLRADHLDAAVVDDRRPGPRGSVATAACCAASPPSCSCRRIRHGVGAPNSCSPTSPRPRPLERRAHRRQVGRPCGVLHLEQDAALEVDAEVQPVDGDDAGSSAHDHHRRERRSAPCASRMNGMLACPGGIELQAAQHRGTHRPRSAATCGRRCAEPGDHAAAGSRVTAVNIEVRMPIDSVTAKPRTGPEPKT